MTHSMLPRPPSVSAEGRGTVDQALVWLEEVNCLTQEEARQEVLSRFGEWAVKTSRDVPYVEPDGGFVFYSWLRANYPAALELQARGDKWQRVHIRLRNAGLVTR